MPKLFGPTPIYWKFKLELKMSLDIWLIDSKHWSAVITYRGEKIRIISVRRSREEGVVLYEG